jgi:acid phosphatase type 7
MPRTQATVVVIATVAALATSPAAAQAPRRVSVSPAAAALEVGRSLQLRAVVLGARRDTLPLGVRWTSTDTAKARVSAAGVVLARDTGAVTIVATSGTARGVVRLALRPAVLVGAGDIGACDLPGAAQTGRLLDRIAGTVFTAGDNAYPNGTRGQFAACYDPAWGRQKARTRPTPGNHDYRVPGAASYFEYFGGAAGDPAEGWYAFNLGRWRIYALNSNVADGPGSPQETWLRADLAAHPTRCVLAYWHHARFSSGPHGTSTATAALYRTLYEAGADVLVVGHDHDYERFAPQDPEGRADGARGLREFVVGTGGGPLYDFGRPEPNSEFRYNLGWGVLKLTLFPRGYAWHFIGVEGGRVIDAGSGTCH